MRDKLEQPNERGGFQARTTGAPSADISRVIILERRYYANEAIRSYLLKTLNGMAADTSELQSALASLFLEQQAMFERNMEPQAYLNCARLLLGVENRSYSDLLNCFMVLNNIIDKMRISKLDLKKEYDSTSVIEEDEANGFI